MYTLTEKVEIKMATPETIAPAIQVSLAPILLTQREAIGPTNMITPAKILPT